MLQRYDGMYTGIVELILIQKYSQVLQLILVLRILYLYYEVYPGLTKLILVLLNLFLYFRS